jgi:hypothetical protein
VRKTEEYEKLKLEIEHLKKEANGTEAKGAAA